LRERILADRIVDDGHALAAGQLLGARNEILARVDDRVRAAVRLRELRFRIRSDRADHRDVQRARPLTGDEADAACRRVEQDRFAALQRKRLAEQVLDGQPFQHQRRGRHVVDAVGNLDEALGRHDPMRRVAARRAAAIRNAIARIDPVHARPDRFDDARRLQADARRQ
jgi:hypothetical protein